jgi:DNA-directed RNA polymerase sigma subunit (sigma70/sigma32)
MDSEATAFVGSARGQLAARAQLVESHRRIVAGIVTRYSRSELSPNERIRLGEQGLGKAIDWFELSKGFRFSTYATWHVQQAIRGGMGDGVGTAASF